MLSRGRMIFGQLFLVQGIKPLPVPQRFKERYLRAGSIRVSRPCGYVCMSLNGLLRGGTFFRRRLQQRVRFFLSVHKKNGNPSNQSHSPGYLWRNNNSPIFKGQTIFHTDSFVFTPLFELVPWESGPSGIPSIFLQGGSHFLHINHNACDYWNRQKCPSEDYDCIFHAFILKSNNNWIAGRNFLKSYTYSLALSNRFSTTYEALPGPKMLAIDVISGGELLKWGYRRCFGLKQFIRILMLYCM